MENMETIIEEKNYRFRIDYAKWKAALDATLAVREEERAKTEKKFWSALDYHYDQKLTKLYSIRAHARGRIHRAFALLNEYEWRKLGHKTPDWKAFADNNGAIKFPLTLEDQAAYIGDSWKEYEKAE